MSKQTVGELMAEIDHLRRHTLVDLQATETGWIFQARDRETREELVDLGPLPLKECLQAGIEALRTAPR
ncbi:MAG: hypothetical protein KJ077_11005 [Anaerolineae bacterium]|nr:hypothetical protein [Anaerolineae bacterium]